MTSIGGEPAVTSTAELLSGVGQTEWVERCRVSICERDPLLAADDVLDLAATLWGLTSCQNLLPELVAGLLLDDQLGRLI